MEAIAVAAQLLDEITWDGQALLVAAATENGHVICRVPRETIHALRVYSDLIGREIQLERRNIVEKLALFLIAKLSQVAAGATPELLLWEVEDRKVSDDRTRNVGARAWETWRALEPDPNVEIAVRT
jgi:hypothetical protein